MGYLGSNATFTGTQNHNRISEIALQGQTAFTVRTGYSINAIDVYRNGVRLVTQRDFSALDGVTVTLVEAANENDIIEFVTFENFKRDDVVGTDGDATIRGNISINGNLAITGLLDASVTNTATAGFAQTAGISTQVSGYLGVGVTGYNLNVTGVVTASSFSGSGVNLTNLPASTSITVADESSDTTCFPLFATAATGNLPPKSGTNLTFNSSTGALTATSFVGAVTGNADTATTSTNVTVADESSDTTCFPLFATAATGNLPPKSGTNLTFNSSTGALTSTSFVGALTGNVTGNISGGTVAGSTGTFTDDVSIADNKKFLAGTANDLEIYHDATDTHIDNNTGDLYVETTGAGDDILIQSADDIFLNVGGENGVNILGDGAVELYHNNSKKFETASGGAAVTGSITATTFGTASQNAYGARTVQSGGSPSGGSDGDIYYIY